MRNNIIAAIIGGVIIFLLMYTCNGKQDPIIKTKTVVKYKQGKTITKIDSTWYKKYYELKNLKPKIVYIGRPKRAGKVKDSVGTKLNIFVTEVKDSIIDGKITSKVDGQLISTDFAYEFKQLKISEQSNKVDTVQITTTNKIKTNQLLIGAETSIKPFAEQISVGAVFVHKKNWGAGYRYEHRFDKIIPNSHNISVYKIISFRRKQ